MNKIKQPVNSFVALLIIIVVGFLFANMMKTYIEKKIGETTDFKNYLIND